MLMLETQETQYWNHFHSFNSSQIEYNLNPKWLEWRKAGRKDCRRRLNGRKKKMHTHTAKNKQTKTSKHLSLKFKYLKGKLKWHLSPPQAHFFSRACWEKCSGRKVTTDSHRLATDVKQVTIFFTDACIRSFIPLFTFHYREERKKKKLFGGIKVALHALVSIRCHCLFIYLSVGLERRWDWSSRWGVIVFLKLPVQ